MATPLAAHAMNVTAADISPGLAAARAMLGVDTVSAHPAAVVLFDLLLLPRWWSGPWALFGLTVATMVGLEILSWSVPLTLEHYASKLVRIEPGGRLLHRLVAIDHIYIWWNKFVTACFVIHYLQWMLHGGPQHVVVELSFASMTWTNMIAPLILSFLVYDAMYAPFHRFLHWQPIYPYIHKHHHRHLAPHRGLDDAINTHPVELLGGSYMHMWATALIDLAGVPQHVVSIFTFLALGSVMAALNHTRWVVSVPHFFFNVDHDTHHSKQKFNYAQYSPFMDMLMGTHKWWAPPAVPIESRKPIEAANAPLARAQWPINDAPERCVVTGGNGLVGSRLVAMLAERGAKSVVSIDLALPSAELLETLQQSRNSSVIRHVVSDICDQAALVNHFKGASAVFHTAALVGPFHTTAEYDRVNHQGTRSVVEACRAAAVPVLVVTSSPSTKMDGSDIKHLHEKDLKVPAPGQELEEYARTKALGEAVALAANSDKLRVCAVAPHQVYGTQDRLFLPSMLRAAASGRLRIFGAGDNLISCCHVDNAAHAHILAARQLAAGASGVGGEFFVIADGGAVYFWDAINQAVEACGLQSLHDKFHLSRGLLYPAAYLGQLISKFRSEPFRLTPFTVRMLTMHRYFAIDKAEAALGYRALRSFAEAWPECIQAARTRLQAEGVLPAGGEEAAPAKATSSETKPIKTKRSTKAD